MRKFLAIILFLIIAISPAIADYPFGITFYSSAGFAANRDYNEAVEGITEYWQNRNSEFGMNFGFYNIEDGKENSLVIPEFEFSYRLQDNLAAGFSFSRLALPVGLTRVENAFAQQFEFEDHIQVDMEGQAFLLSLIEYYIFKVNHFTQLNLGAGVDFCLANLKYDLQIRDTFNFENRDISGDFRSSSLGFNLRTQFEFRIKKQLRLIVGGVSRWLKLSNFQGTITSSDPYSSNQTTGEASLYSLYIPANHMDGGGSYKIWYPYYSPQQAQNDHYGYESDEDLRKATIDLSGLQITLGFGVSF